MLSKNKIGTKIGKAMLGGAAAMMGMRKGGTLSSAMAKKMRKESGAAVSKKEIEA